MTNYENPYSQYLNILSSSESEVDKGNISLAKEKLEEYKNLKRKNDIEFQQEIEDYEDSGRGITHFIFDKRCLSISILEDLYERTSILEKKLEVLTKC